MTKDFWEGYVPEPVKPAQREPVVVFREIKVGEYVLRFWPSDNGWMCGITSEMMQALTEQSAQQALDKKAENARELGLDYEPAQPYKGIADHINQAANGRVKIDPVTGDVGIGTPSSQPAQRTWQGLTDEEVRKTINDLNPRNSFIVASAIEAKLKEKNNG